MRGEARGNPQRKGDERMRRKHAICAAGAATRAAFGPNDAHVPPSRKIGALGRSSFVLLRPFFYSGQHEYEQTKPLSCEFDAGARPTGWVRSCAPCATSPCGKSLFRQRLWCGAAVDAKRRRLFPGQLRFEYGRGQARPRRQTWRFGKEPRVDNRSYCCRDCACGFARRAWRYWLWLLAWHEGLRRHFRNIGLGERGNRARRYDGELGCAARAERRHRRMGVYAGHEHRLSYCAGRKRRGIPAERLHG